MVSGVIRKYNAGVEDRHNGSGRGGRNPPAWWFMARGKAIEQGSRPSKAYYFQQVRRKRMFGKLLALAVIKLEPRRQKTRQTLIRNDVSHRP